MMQQLLCKYYYQHIKHTKQHHSHSYTYGNLLYEYSQHHFSMVPHIYNQLCLERTLVIMDFNNLHFHDSKHILSTLFRKINLVHSFIWTIKNQ